MQTDAARRCSSCYGSGEIGTESGPADCPDCGGSGQLPSPDTLIEWRARDIERAYASRGDATTMDVRWLIAELRRARGALTEIVALAQDASDGDPITMRIRGIASNALGYLETTAQVPSA
jgi:hypothetical protein